MRGTIIATRIEYIVTGSIMHINNNVNNRNNRNGSNIIVMNDHVACSLSRGSICIYSKHKLQFCLNKSDLRTN